MQFKRMLLMCSALITLAYSFPTNIERNITSVQQNTTNPLNTKENENPLVFIMEEKDPRSDSVIVEFVYSSKGSSMVQSNGSEKDKYVINNPVQQESKDKKSIQISSTDKAAQKPEIKSGASNFHETSLVPQEESHLSFKWPKYFFDTFNPIKPFPELEFGKPNQKTTDKISTENDKTYALNYRKEKKEIPHVAGPQLNPLSLYDREFYVPIFD